MSAANPIYGQPQGLAIGSRMVPPIPCSSSHQVPGSQGERDVGQQHERIQGTLEESMAELPLRLPSDQIRSPPLGGASIVFRLLSQTLSHLTMYGELSSALRNEDFQRVRVRLQQEWLVCYTLLVALAAINSAAFAISPDAIFKIGTYAYLAVATSSVTSGLGIACTVWFLLRYQWVKTQTFITRSRDVYGSYIFFSLSSRVPAFCTLVSSISIMIFLGIVAFDAWPKGVLVLGIVVVVIMCLQFLVYAAHRCAAHITMGCLLAAHTAQAFLGMTGADENV